MEYAPLGVRGLLRQRAEREGDWYWSLDPYQGCQFACTFCSARLDREDYEPWRRFERAIGVKANAVEVFLREVRAEDFEGRPVVLGARSDPWQQAEERFRLTRSLLEAMRRVERLDLRIHTRASLIARDVDLLRELSARGPVTVTFSLASLDEKIHRLMEPMAPSPLRRLSAVEALARAGVKVGLLVSPLLPGLDPAELGLEGLLTRTANAGARFAGHAFLHFEPGERERFLAHVTRAYPEAAVRFRRVIGRRAPSGEERAAMAKTFGELCRARGLLPLEQAARALETAAPHPSQLSLFGA